MMDLSAVSNIPVAETEPKADVFFLKNGMDSNWSNVKPSDLAEVKHHQIENRQHRFRDISMCYACFRDFLSVPRTHIMLKFSSTSSGYCQWLNKLKPHFNDSAIAQLRQLPFGFYSVSAYDVSQNLSDQKVLKTDFNQHYWFILLPKGFSLVAFDKLTISEKVYHHLDAQEASEALKQS